MAAEGDRYILRPPHSNRRVHDLLRVAQMSYEWPHGRELQFIIRPVKVLSVNTEGWRLRERPGQLEGEEKQCDQFINDRKSGEFARDHAWGTLVSNFTDVGWLPGQAVSLALSITTLAPLTGTTPVAINLQDGPELLHGLMRSNKMQCAVRADSSSRAAQAHAPFIADPPAQANKQEEEQRKQKVGAKNGDRACDRPLAQSQAAEGVRMLDTMTHPAICGAVPRVRERLLWGVYSGGEDAPPATSSVNGVSPFDPLPRKPPAPSSGICSAENDGRRLPGLES
ncbi:hypothetical protein C8R47DRAFT_1298973 [Mycena vitilis]|nr:hypothetical protein C8R47DRAFT_1298973 [Mycena vitilis]